MTFPFLYVSFHRNDTRWFPILPLHTLRRNSFLQSSPSPQNPIPDSHPTSPRKNFHSFTFTPLPAAEKFNSGLSHLFPAEKISILPLHIHFRHRTIVFYAFTGQFFGAKPLPLLSHRSPPFFFGRFHFRTLREVALCKDFIFQAIPTQFLSMLQASEVCNLLKIVRDTFSSVANAIRPRISFFGRFHRNNCKYFTPRTFATTLRSCVTGSLRGRERS